MSQSLCICCSHCLKHSFIDYLVDFGLPSYISLLNSLTVSFAFLLKLITFIVMYLFSDEFIDQLFRG